MDGYIPQNTGKGCPNLQSGRRCGKRKPWLIWIQCRCRCPRIATLSQTLGASAGSSNLNFLANLSTSWRQKITVLKFWSWMICSSSLHDPKASPPAETVFFVRPCQDKCAECALSGLIFPTKRPHLGRKWQKVYRSRWTLLKNTCFLLISPGPNDYK